MFLRVTPMTGVGRALKSKKLTPKFIGPYQISERVGCKNPTLSWELESKMQESYPELFV